MEGKEYEAFTEAVIALDGVVRCGEIISDTVRPIVAIDV